MKIGVCGGGINEWKKITPVGYDYCEGNLSYFASYSEEDFAETLKQAEKLPIFVETTNGFFAGDVKLYEVDNAWLKSYCERAFSRAAKLGVKVSVLGSGGARRIPDGMGISQAQKRFAEILNVCGDVAGEYGIKIAIEPLRYAECNFINTVSDSMELVLQTNHPCVGTLVDFFHFYSNGEPLSELDGLGDKLFHTHIARPNPTRGVPRGEDTVILQQWAEKLKQIVYRGRMSLECSWAPDYVTAMQNAYEIMNIFREV